MLRNLIFVIFLIISPVYVLADGKPKSSWNNLYIIFIYIGFFTLAILISMMIRRYRSGAFGGNTDNQLPVRAARGLDTEDIESLPSLRFSEIKMHKVAEAGQLECSVCLNEFKDQEILRLLPDCLHVYHPDCIGPWLSSHVTCPVCRTSVDHRRGSSVSTSSILERVSGTYSERLDNISGILSSDLYDDNEDDGVEIESVIEIEGGGKLEFTDVRLDGTRESGRLVRCYSTGDLAIRFEGEIKSEYNSGSSSSRVSSRKNETNEKSPKLVQLSCISSKSDSFVDYSSLLFVHGKTN